MKKKLIFGEIVMNFTDLDDLKNEFAVLPI